MKGTTVANGCLSTTRYMSPRNYTSSSRELNAGLKDPAGIARWKQFRLENEMMRLDLDSQPEPVQDPWYRSAKQQEIGQRKALEACNSTIFARAPTKVSNQLVNLAGDMNGLSIDHREVK